MLFFLIFLLSILYFLYQGYSKGIAKFAFRLISLIAAYLAALLFTQPLAPVVSNSTPLNGLVAYLVTGILLFTGTSLITSGLLTIIYKLITRDGKKVSQVSRITGGLVGAVAGGFIGILLIWVVSLSKQVLIQNPDSPANISGPVEASGIEKMAKSVVGSMVKGAISVTTDQPEVAELTAKLLESPEITVRQFRGVTESEEFRSLFLAASNQRILNTGDVELIKQSAAFKQLIKNPHFKALSQDLYDTDGADFETQMAEKIRDMWARAQFVQNDPEMQSILNDPQIKELMANGQVAQLMNSQKIIQLFERIMSSDAKNYSIRQKAPEPSTKLTRTDEQSIKDSKVYKWVDEDGQVHYSDKPPEKDDSQ